MSTDTQARWYSVDALGMATLCRDERDAIKTAADNSIQWPNLAPHRAVRLAEVDLKPEPSAVVDERPTMPSPSMPFNMFTCAQVETLHLQWSNCYAALQSARQPVSELEAELADMRTTMMAAAVEIQEHWDAHCDSEGYGPANLMHRLERGIASQYGYDAKTLLRVKAERDSLGAEVAALRVDAQRYRWLREYRNVTLLTAYFGNGCINRTMAEVDAAIDLEREAKQSQPAQGGEQTK